MPAPKKNVASYIAKKIAKKAVVKVKPKPNTKAMPKSNVKVVKSGAGLETRGARLTQKEQIIRRKKYVKTLKDKREHKKLRKFVDSRPDRDDEMAYYYNLKFASRPGVKKAIREAKIQHKQYKPFPKKSK